jgi:apolipoprotein N-acyltransferase
MALALPGPGLVPLVLFVPGLLRRAVGGRRGWAAVRTGWLAGFVQWGVAVPWVVIVLHRYGHAPLALAIAGWLAMAAILGTTWALAAWVAGMGRQGWLPWSLPLSLVACEVLQGFPPWHFPWNPVAAVITGWPWLLAPVAVVGAAGLSFLLLALGASLDALVDTRMRRVGAWQLGAVAVLAVVTTVLSPGFRPVGKLVRVAAVQPDVPLEVRWDNASLSEIERSVWGLTREAAESGAEWIVWPESAVPRLVDRDGGYRGEIEAFTRLHRVWMLVGSIGLGGDVGGEYFNSVYTFAPSGKLPWRYDKVHLVPFGEYVPVLGRIALLRPLVKEVGAFAPGRSLMAVPGPAGSTGVEVCYEVAFSSLAAQQVALGAGVLATITNDGWYGDSAAPRQHLALAQLRAAESRRYFVRAANTGISAIIDPAGRCVSTLGMGKRGLVSGMVQAGEGITAAVSHGEKLRLAIVGLALGVILAGAWARRISRTRAPDVAAARGRRDA